MAYGGADGRDGGGRRPAAGRDASSDASFAAPVAFFDVGGIYNVFATESLLWRAVAARGRGARIFLTAKETADMNIEAREKQACLWRRQVVGDTEWLRPLCAGWCAFLMLAAIGATLVGLGAAVLADGRHFVLLRRPYAVGDSAVRFDFADFGGGGEVGRPWDTEGPFNVYVDIDGFEQCHRPYFSSRPRELFSGYSCRGGELTVADLTKVRSLASLGEEGEALAQLAPGTAIFPCGLTAFAIFNDEFKIVAPNGTEVPVEPPAAATPSFGYGLAPLASLRRPSDVNAPDWLEVTGAAYRSWLTSGVGSRKRMFVGRFKSSDFRVGDAFFEAQFSRNLWPAAEWNAEKFITVSRHGGSFGDARRWLGLFYLAWGLALLLLALLFCGLYAAGVRVPTASSAELPDAQIAETIARLKAENTSVMLRLIRQLRELYADFEGGGGGRAGAEDECGPLPGDRTPAPGEESAGDGGSAGGAAADAGVAVAASVGAAAAAGAGTPGRMFGQPSPRSLAPAAAAAAAAAAGADGAASPRAWGAASPAAAAAASPAASPAVGRRIEDPNSTDNDDE